MTHHNLQFVAPLGCSLGVCSFIILTVLTKTRTAALPGLAGSILLSLGIIRGEFFHDLAGMLILEVIGTVLLFASCVLLVKRRYS